MENPFFFVFLVDLGRGRIYSQNFEFSESKRTNLRETLSKTEDEIGAETLALHFIATEIGHKNVQILLKLAETLA